MKNHFLKLMFIVFVSCAATSPEIPPAKSINPIIEKISSPIQISPGEMKWIKLKANSSPEKVVCNQKEVKYQFHNRQLDFLIINSYFNLSSSFKCHVSFGDENYLEIIVKVKPKTFAKEKLKVSPKTIKLSQKDLVRVAQEQEILNKIYASSPNSFLFNQPFDLPLQTFITSPYGIRRVYNNEHKGQHLGTDFRAPVGLEIPSANDGKVVFAGELFYTGFTVIIDHGLDLFTVYGHLSKLRINQGTNVKKGEIIGLAGATGRASGPHLHWGVKIQGQYIDGLNLIAETKRVYE